MYSLNEKINKFDEKIPIKAHINDSDIDVISAPTHFHNELELIYVIEGAAQYTVFDEEITVEAGNIIFFNKQVEHSSRTLGHLRIVLLQFGADLLRDFFAGRAAAFDELLSKDFKYLVIDTRSRAEFAVLPDLMLSTVYEFNEKAPAYEFVIISNILKMLTAILRADASKSYNGYIARKSRPASDLVIQYIADNYNRDITIAEVAAHFHFSTSYFSHLFKEITGMSFVKYLNEYRINSSKKLLMSPRHTITSAMVQVGFTNRSYYNRLFKRTTGFTPQEFRNNFFSRQKKIK